MGLIEQRIKALLGKEMALLIDAEIWWLALEEHYKTYVVGVFCKMVDDARPRWMPRKIWNYLHRGFNK